MKAIEQLVQDWRDRSMRARPGANEEVIRRVFAQLGVSVSSDVLALYQAVGGMDTPDFRDWRLWTLAEIAAQQNARSAAGVEFSDYLVGCWSFRVKPISADESEVFLDYGNAKAPVRVAPTLEQFLQELSTDPLRVLDPQVRR